MKAAKVSATKLPGFKLNYQGSTFPLNNYAYLQAHVHPSGFARLSFYFRTVYLLDAVFSLVVISQITIFTYVKFAQYIQGDNGPLKKEFTRIKGTTKRNLCHLEMALSHFQEIKGGGGAH